MKTKLFYCEECEKKTIHYVENVDKTFSAVIGIFTAGLVVPRDMEKTCSECGKTTEYDGDVICGVL